MNIIPLRVALAQINVTVGDLEGNTQKILASMRQAHEAGAHIVCVPELALPGYPPEDLLVKPGFVAANLCKLDELVDASRDLLGLTRSEEHTSELQSPCNLVCRLLLEKKNQQLSPQLNSCSNLTPCQP